MGIDIYGAIERVVDEFGNNAYIRITKRALFIEIILCAYKYNEHHYSSFEVRNTNPKSMVFEFTYNFENAIVMLKNRIIEYRIENNK